MHYNYLIIGGGIAGVTAAETIRGLNKDATIAIMSQEPHLLYSRVLLPNYVKKKIRKDQVFLRTIDDFEKKDIVLLLEKEAVFLDVAKREVKAKSGEICSFDKLLIASGGAPMPVNIPGEKLAGVFRLQTLDDADSLLEALPEAKKAIVIGGGFIGLEFLEIAHVYKIPTVLLSRGPKFFENVLDSTGGELMRKNFERFGINAIFEDEVVEFGGKERVSGVRTKKGIVVDGDIVGVGIGLKMNDNFSLGIGLGSPPQAGVAPIHTDMPERGIRVNEFLETANPGIFAAGDVAEYFNVSSGRFGRHGNWTNAFLQGRTAGQNMAGKERLVFKNVPFYSTTNLGLHITFLGDTEEGEGAETVSRNALPGNMYERFFLREGKLAGAVIINMFHDKPALAELIEKGVLINNARENLTDMSFEIKTLLG
ncbi:MAG: FAD-dependent oxidoreductase [bacterium]|nr:FAD-dependent oxidoreductase [bacterium]